ncbi:MAG: hypothetical protein IT272_13870 [Chitinophagales bacterium]|nr:hypothetical protein [Sphingobacteriales bacterium]MBP9142594.1 hypothetical protein [Chitinophagales bacterium]MDA0199499.1 hypothetical protein [Bacteroidota bacterium]MBK6890426.1 hypothetical protein [Sphingobacteriales bacterium]MBK8679908.1 hypothetical protein [Sphingobacteriales bacterium]
MLLFVQHKNRKFLTLHTFLDTTDKILAGSFEFTAMDSRGELVYITEGRFDISNK